MFRISATAALLVATAGLAACQTTASESAGDHHVTGQAAYRERIALAPGSTFNVSVQDISLADAPSQEVGQVTRALKGEQVPLPFTVSIKAASLQANHRYSLRATITGPDGRLAWTTDTVYPIDPNLEAQDIGTVNLVRVSSAQ